VEEGLASVSVLSGATPRALHRRLSEQVIDVVHYIGHGSFDEETGEGCLFLEDGRGRPKAVDAEAFRQILGRRGTDLVFLNACESGRGGRVDFNRGVAPALVAAGMPAVVANQYSVLDDAATAFAREFYAALARGRPLGEASREARVAVGHTTGAEALDWAVPVLFARDPGATLRAPRAAPRRRAKARAKR
jgi:CHAT domain-containing protein